jgi:hypothetical protein
VVDVDLPAWVTHGENKVRRLRRSDSALDRLTGELLKASVELPVAILVTAAPMMVAGAAHPDIDVTYRLSRDSILFYWAPVFVFFAGYLRCWFAS